MQSASLSFEYLTLLLFLVDISRAAAIDVTTSEFWSLSARAAVLADDIFFDERPAPPGATVRVSKHNLDKAMVWTEPDVCWMVFRGTTPTIADWWQNGHPGKEPICNNMSGKCCTVRQGFYDAYSKPSYTEELEKVVRDCKADCPECTLILTGHSQGAAIALVASVVLADLSPIVIGWGQPNTIVGNCDGDLIDESRFYRFINTRTKGKDFDYDLVPVTNSPRDRRGRVVLLGEDKNKVKYYESQPDFPYITNFNTRAHSMEIYRSKAVAMSQAPSVSVDGFSEAHGCNLNSECEDGVCLTRKCTTAGPHGSHCKEDDDCASRRCDRPKLRFLSHGKCRTRLATGARCREDSDCLSGKCSGRFSGGCRFRFAIGVKQCVCRE